MLNFREKLGLIMVSREMLIVELYDAVVEAHEKDPNMLGVILFGSRARPTWHALRARDDSDVDLIHLYRDEAKDGSQVLNNCIGKRLQRWSLIEHPGGCGYITDISLEKILRGEVGSDLIMVRIGLRLLDQYSEVISEDPTMAMKVKRARKLCGCRE